MAASADRDVPSADVRRNIEVLQWFVTAKDEGRAVAEVVKTFGSSTEAETLDEFRYPAILPSPTTRRRLPTEADVWLYFRPLVGVVTRRF